jgi:hypothetical protein
MPIASSIVACNTEPFIRRTSAWTYLCSHFVFINILSLCVVGVIVIAYIIQVNGDITKGYQIRELETQLSTLSLQNQQLEVIAREAQSLEHVARSVKMMGFVEAEMPTYITSSTPAVALAQ